MSYVTYHEPNLTQVLVLSSFLYLANVARWVGDRYLYAGLLGEIAVGIVFGSPLAGILDNIWEQTFLSLGYIGLLVIVFEGGLTTPLKTLLRSLPLATLIALTGIAAPIALSFVLVPLGYEPLEAFAAGASLSSTSLGTTFVVLKAVGGDPEPAKVDGAQSSEGERDASAGLETTRLGTILAGAAVFDDVVGFVLSSVISTLGSTLLSPASIDPWAIARPLATSLAFSLIAPLVIKYLLSPLFHRLLPPRRLQSIPYGQHLALFLLVATFSACLAITYVIGSSMLLGAYVAGLIVSALDNGRGGGGQMRQAFEDKISPVQTHLLSPLFFASIGTAIPFLSLWRGKIIWQGLTYSLLMVLAKLICGAWILVWGYFEDAQATRTEQRTQVLIDERGIEMQDGVVDGPDGGSNSRSSSSAGGSGTSTPVLDPSDQPGAAPEPEPETNSTASSHHPVPSTPIAPPRTSHVPPALFIGLALVARGEIGLLISQLAHAEAGLLGDDAFLVTTWAIVLCTIIGPVSVGLLVRKLGVGGVVRGRWV